MCAAHFILGAAFISLNFFRFAAAESVAEQWKGKSHFLHACIRFDCCLYRPDDLIQRFGSTTIIPTGFLLLTGAGLVAANGISASHFYVSLVLLGVGWSFSFIGSKNLLQSSVSEQERPLIQGMNDTTIAIASSLASLSSGALYAGFGWHELALTTVIALLATLIILSAGKRFII